MADISKPVLKRLAAMICGHVPYQDNFPYRTGGQLTQFFDDLFLDYQHDGSTRQTWVETVLEELAHPSINVEHTEAGLDLTENLAKVITHVVDPIHFDRSRHAAAIEQLNEALEHANLHVVFDNQSRRTFVLPLDDPMTLDETGPVESGRSMPGVIIVRPTVFQKPEHRDSDRPECAVLMPFGALFDEIYHEDLNPAIKSSGFSPIRADEIWRNEVLINDIFDMIYHASVIVTDLSQRNPNVLYELGIAHTLGKLVIPIVQNPEDVPFDLRHHRYLRYEPTRDGRMALRHALKARLESLPVRSTS